MKKLYFGSNLKMYKGAAATREYLERLADNTRDISREETEIFIIPSYTALHDAVKCCRGRGITIGAQNMCWEEEGQFTGEISPGMLEEAGVSLVMTGHSERRHVFKETDAEENKKVRTALNHGFQTLLCVGETAKEKQYGVGAEVLKTQLKIGFYNVDPADTGKLRVAYEPVWSIGENGVPAPADYAEKMHRVIKETLREIFSDAGADIPVLYGGSVNPGNADRLIVQPSVDGLFVGRAAWNPDDFDKLIRNAKACVQN